MPKAARPRVRRIPQRTCVGCRQVLPKRTLVRVVSGPNGIQVDPTGKAAGRGAYLHNRRSCWEQALRGDVLEHALRAPLAEADRARLRQFGETMPPGDD